MRYFIYRIHITKYNTPYLGNFVRSYTSFIDTNLTVIKLLFSHGCEYVLNNLVERLYNLDGNKWRWRLHRFREPFENI